MCAADAACLSVYQHAHLNVHGYYSFVYSFVLPNLAGGRHSLRNPTRRRPRSVPKPVYISDETGASRGVRSRKDR